LATLALTLVAVSSCGSDSEGSASGGPTGALCPTTSDLAYDSFDNGFGRAFMEQYCTRCHSSMLAGAARNGAPSDHDFDSLAGIRMASEHIDEQAAAGPDHVNTSMPPSGPRPSEAERRQLGEWLACGAP
jgi:mono/diheme cytochrome c family protein